MTVKRSKAPPVSYEARKFAASCNRRWRSRNQLVSDLVSTRHDLYINRQNLGPDGKSLSNLVKLIPGFFYVVNGGALVPEPFMTIVQGTQNGPLTGAPDILTYCSALIRKCAKHRVSAQMIDAICQSTGINPMVLTDKDFKKHLTCVIRLTTVDESAQK